MYIVKKPFKNFGKVYTAGTVITEPADIKRFKGKLAEGKIIEVTEQTYGATHEYFKSKFGVDIPSLQASTDIPGTEDINKLVANITEEDEGNSPAPATDKPKVVSKVVATAK